jgi:hypothetical protein
MKKKPIEREPFEVYAARVRGDRFKKVGLDITKLTENQIDIINQPSEAPENFYCDGEISGSQANSRWLQQLVNSGLNKSDIAKARKLQNI